MSKQIKIINKCAYCGSTKVDIKAWVNLNTLKYSGATDEPEIWCNNCETTTEIITTEK